MRCILKTPIHLVRSSPKKNEFDNVKIIKSISSQEEFSKTMSTSKR